MQYPEVDSTKDASSHPLPPRPPNVVGTIYKFWRDPLEHCLELTRRFGNVVRLGFNGFYLISHPNHVEHVLQKHNNRYWKGSKVHVRAGAVFGNGLVTNEGEAWRRQRRMIAPAFSEASIRKYSVVMVAETTRMLDRWRPAAKESVPIDVLEEMAMLSRNIVTSALLGSQRAPNSAKARSALTALGAYMGRALRTPVYVPPHIPTPGNLRLRRALAVIDRVFADIIELERDRGHENQSVIGRLVHTRDEQTGAAMSATQIRDEVVTLFLAGHETSAGSHCWAFHALAKHPEIRAKVEFEVDRVLGGRAPGFDDADRLPYTRSVLQEVLRLYPPAWVVSRSPYADDSIGGYRIPAGCTLLVSPYVTHRRSDVWDDPERFDPNRFDSARLRSQHRFSWYPFSGGPRNCIGHRFAMVQGILVLALCTQRYRLDLPPGVKVVARPRLTLEPEGLAMTLVDRDR